MKVEEGMELLERDERALEGIANALKRLADTAEKFYSRLYPEKHGPRDLIITTPATAEEKDRQESIQGSEETLEQWKELGPREREFLEKAKTTKSGSSS